jgi:haloalkane dehalogenase
MAYIDEGEGAPIIFQHGNPTSSYLWRNVMPSLRGLGRLIAADLIGMGDSDKLRDSGPDSYTFAQNREFLFALWEELGVKEDVVLVLHDWGSALGFDWANQHRSSVQGIAYMESITMPMTWADHPPISGDAFRAIRSPAGEDLVLRDNMFVEKMLPLGMFHELTDDEWAEYRKPFLNPGEDRRPTLTMARQLPLDGEPADVHAIVRDYARWLKDSDVPKLWIRGEPGIIMTESVIAFNGAWPNQTEVKVRGMHYLQEDSPTEIGEAVATFVRGLRQK